MTIARAFDIDQLRDRVKGEVVTATDNRYDQARRVFYGGVDPRPSAVVEVVDTADVASVLEFVRRTGAELAVRSGGHSVAAHSTTRGGVVLDLRDLNRVEIDPETRTAWAGAGLTAAELTRAVGQHGLAIGFGDTGSVGIGGITLGGGLGFLSRKHGLTIDSLLAAEIVTADGSVLMVDAQHHPELFWALRGGGGNFGVVTRFRYALAPVDNVVGGMIVLPATPETVAGFLAESEAAPDELTTIANVMSCPPMPGVPNDVVGQTVILGLIMWCGEIEAGHHVMARFRSLADPIVDMLAVMPYAEIYGPEDEDYQPLAFGLNGFTDHVDDEKIDTLLRAIASSDAPLRVVQMRVHGGAIARVPADATAFAHRHRRVMLNVASFYESDQDKPRREAWVRGLFEQLTDGDDAAYVGFLADEGEARLRAAYPGSTWDRLCQVKAAYDPDNVFRRNQNIPPAR